MVEISKAEAKYLRENGVREITRVMKQDSKRKHFWCAEEKSIMELLNTYRNSQKIIFTYGIVD